MEELGRIAGLYRYPVKSMAGESLERAALGWRGLEGDRRLAFLRERSSTGFPWLTASRLPALIQYRPLRRNPADSLPSHVRTPAGHELALAGPELRDELSQALGEPVRLVRLDQGTFDQADVAVITSGTLAHIGRLAGFGQDVRRFRPNILIEAQGDGFIEDAWVGGRLAFGDPSGPTLLIAERDLRCVMVNLDPDGGPPNAQVLKTIVEQNASCAGVYARSARIGSLAVGERVFLLPF